MVAPIRFLSGRQQQQKIGVPDSTEDLKVLEVIGRVGIGTTIFEPTEQLDVRGNANLSGVVTATQLFVGGIEITNGASIGEDLDARNSNLSGISTVGGLTDLNGGLDVTGLSTFNDGLSISGIVSVTNTTENTLGNADTGAVQIDGGLGVNGNVTVGFGISVTSDSHFVGEVLIGPDAHLSLSHDYGVTNHSRIKDTGLGDLVFESNGNFVFVDDAGHYRAQFDGGVELYEGNDKKFQTVGSGVSVLSGTASTATIYGPGRLNIKPDSDVSTGLLFIDGDLNVSGFVTGITTFSNLSNFNNGISVDETGNFNNGINVEGVSTLSNNVNIQGTLDVTGQTDTDTLNVSGLSTFSSNVDINAGLDVDGFTELDATNISETLSVSGLSTFSSNVDVNASVDISTDLTVDGLSDLDELNVTGLSTFSSNVDVNASVDISTDLTVDGLSDLDELNVSGVTTFTDTVSFGTSAYFGDNDRLFFGDGNDLQIFHNPNNGNSVISEFGSGNLHINADNLQIKNGGATEVKAKFITDGAVELYHDNSKKFETTGIGVSIVNGTSDTATIYGPSNLIIDPMPIGVGTTSGIVRIKGDLYVDGTTTQINSSTIQLADFVVGIATTATSNALADGAGIEIGPSNINFKYYYNGNTNPSLKSSENLNIALNKVYQINQVEVLSSTTLGSGVVNSSLTNVGTLTELNVSGISTFGSDLDINASIDVSGISTFSSSVDINAGLDVDGFTELDATNISETLSVSGLSTFSSNVDINAGLDVDGFTELDGVNVSETLSVSGLSTFGSNVDVNANLDVDGFTELDSTNISETLSVSGISTFSSLVDINAGLDVDGFTELDSTNISETLSVSGLSTFASNVDVNASVDISTDLTVDGLSDLDELNVTGLSTFSSNVDVNAGLDVDGLSDLDELNVTGLSTFSSNVDVNAGLDVDGFTELDSTNISETLSVSGLSTFSSNVDINAGLDVDGFTELDSTNISETLSVSGISTFSSLVDINAGLDVDGFTELDATNISETLSVSGLSTFSSNVDVNASVDINNDLTVHGDIDIDTITTTSAVTATLSTTTETAVHSGLSTATYRSVEYTIQVTEGTNYHSTKILAVHDGTTAYHSEYGTVYTNSSVATFDVDLNGGNIRLLATGSTSNSTVYKIYFTATKL